MSVVIGIYKYPRGSTGTDIHTGGTERKTGKHSDTSRYKFTTISLLKRLRNGRFASEAAARQFQK
jgi:hypothetical protein